MKVLIVTDLYPLNEHHKGIARTIENFALALRDLGHKIYVLRADLVPNSLLRGRMPYKQGHYTSSGIEIYNQNFILPFYFSPKIPDDFDVIISHMPSGTLCAQKVKKKFNRPFMAVAHSSDIEVLKKYKIYFSSALKHVLNCADIVAARSFWIKKELKNYIDKEIALVPSGIKKSEVLNEDRALVKFDNINEIKIVCIASLIKRKNLMPLIEAINELQECNISLKIFGCGPLEKKLKKKAKNEKIKFLGHRAQGEIFDALSEAHIFILPSLRETFGLSYLEALAKGCITICSNNSGMSGYITDNKNGFIIAPTKDGIKNIIKKIAAKNPNELKEISKNALKLASELEYYKCAKNYLDNIKNLCK